MFWRKATDKPMSRTALIVWDTVLVIFGTFLYAVSVVVFSAPNQIAPGGVSGIATLINFVFPQVSIGFASLVMNIPLMLLGFFKLGKEFMVKTCISLVTFTVFTDYVLADMPVYTGNMLLASVFGGVLMGVGIGLIMWRLGSTGGTDIICKLLQKSMPHLKMGVISFAVDFVVIVISAFVYQTMEAALYAIISVFVFSRAMDIVMYGFDVSKTMLIISEHCDEIAHYITDDMNRGATLVDGIGAYTRQKRPFLICAVSQSEYMTLTRRVKEIDPTAFIIVMASAEIYGEGFKESLEK